jgi:uncharacterized membrane protein
MNLPGHLLPVALNLAAFALWIAALSACVRYAPWAWLKSGVRVHVFLGTIVCLALLWRVSAEIGPGLRLHFLGATLCTLMFDLPLAVVAMALVLLAQAAAGALHPEAIGLNGLMTGLFPVLVSAAVSRLARRFLPAHLFVYFFVNSFFAAGVAMMATGTISSFALKFWSAAAPTFWTEELPAYFMLMSWGEAFLTGMAMTLLVVYRPDWVRSFDDATYLGRR